MVTKQGYGFGLAHEGIFLEAYKDPVGIWTVGAGHATTSGLPPKPVPGMRITLAKALNIYMSDVAVFERGVKAALHGVLAPNEIDGFTFFHMNTGAIKTGSVDDKWNRGQRSQAIATLRLYVNANGRRLNGLVRRRNEEAAIITDGVYPSASILLKESNAAPGRRITVDDLPWQLANAKTELTYTLPPSVPPLPEKRPETNIFSALFKLVRGLFK